MTTRQLGTSPGLEEHSDARAHDVGGERAWSDSFAPAGARDTPDHARLERRYTAVLAFAVLLLTLITRLPALVQQGPIDDEAVYSVVAVEMLHGGHAYVDAIERKPPLLFWSYEAVFAVAGAWNWTALHLFGVTCVLLTAAGLYVLARHFFAPDAAAFAALMYVAFQHWGTSKNLAVNGELLMNVPIVWAGVLVFGRRRNAALFVAGVLTGIAFLMKQPAGIAVVAYGLYLLLPSDRRSRGITKLGSLLHAGLLVSGFALSIAAVAAILATQGILREAIYWTIGDHDVPHVFWARAILFTAAFCGACLPLLLAATPSILRARWWPAGQADRTGLLLLLGLSAIGVSASGRFYPHYYIQLLPSLAIFAAATYEVVAFQAEPRRFRLVRARFAAAVGIMLAGLFVAQWVGIGPMRHSTAIGAYLREHARSDDRLFVWGQLPRIYDDARLRPASRYVTTFPLTGYVFGGPIPGVDTRSRILKGSWDNLLADFARHPPTFIVDTEIGPDASDPLPSFPTLAAIVRNGFTPILFTADGVLYARQCSPNADSRDWCQR